MIFITIGTQKFQFNRLLQIVDELIEEGIINDTVYAQTGNSNYVPKNYKYLNFISHDDFLNKIKESNVVITHGGVGSILNCLKNSKKTIIMPRLSMYNEHIDNHQLEISKKYYDLGYVLYCTNKEEMCECFKKIDGFESKYTRKDDSQLIKKIVDFIEGDL